MQPAMAAGSDFERLSYVQLIIDLINAAGGVSLGDVDGRIAAWARITPIGDVPDGSIPAGIARDTELAVFALIAGHGATFTAA